MKELVSLLRRGDIIAHAFHGKGSTILTDEGVVLAEVRQARERGVIFDAANGRSHFSMNTARRAIANGFLPDIISSDLSTITKLAACLRLTMDFIEIFSTRRRAYRCH